MSKEIEAKIRILKDKLNDLTDAGYSDHSTANEIRAHIRELQDQLPHRPVTLEGPGGARASYPAKDAGTFKSFGDQLQAIVRAGTPGGQVDDRLYKIRDIRAATGLSETVPSEGGFILQSDFSYDLLRGAFETGTIANRCKRLSLRSNTNSIKIPMIDETSRATGSRWGGIQSYWIGEADEKTRSKPKFRQLELVPKKVVGLCYATDELLADSSVLEMVIREGFRDELMFSIDDSIINGTGAGQPLGILNSGAVVTADKEVGQDKHTFVLENALNMFRRIPGRNRGNAVWLINQDVEPQLYTMSLAVGTGGGPCFLPGGGASDEPYSTLLGRPLIPIEQCPSLGNAGDVILADLSQYVLADCGGLQADMSIHVRFLHDESVFRFVYRVDGQPSWAAPVTPFKGSDPLSPFVILEDRLAP